MRRRFPDRLARVRRVREIEERVARAAWAAAEARANEAEERRMRLRAGLDASRAGIRATMEHGTIDPETTLVDHTAVDAQLRALQAADVRWMTQLAQAQELVDVWRRREADRRALDELTKRARDRHRAAVRSAENAEMDEVAAQRDARTRPAAERGKKFATNRETGSSPRPRTTD